MKTEIYYFTGTGNSLVVANDLAEKLQPSETIPIAGLIEKESIISNADRIGIVFPVYIWTMPLIVREFAEKLQIPESTYVFGIATYGSMPGASLLHLNKTLRGKGLKLSAGFGIRMPGNYTPLYGAIPDEKQQKLFAQEKKEITEISEIIRTGKPSGIKSDFFLLNIFFSGLIGKSGISRISGMDKNFWVNEKCTGCAICASVCPVENIEMVEGKPRWKHSCQQCMACLQWCPEESIQYGKKTSARRRYHHRDIEIAEIINQKVYEPDKSSGITEKQKQQGIQE